MWEARRPAFRATIMGEQDGAFTHAVALAGGTVVADGAGGDALLVLDATGGDWDALLPWAERADIVCCGLDRLDDVAGALLLTDAQLLCEPTMADRVAALAVAAGLGHADLAPAVREGEGARLARFSEEVARIADVLARLATTQGDDVADRRAAFDAGPIPGAMTVAIDPAQVRALIRARRLRDGFFGDGLFEEPAWDMMLDLFAAELEGARVSVSSLCIAAAVAPTTALRWIGRLTAEGWFERRPDPRDRRRAFVALGARGNSAMRGYFAALGRG